LIEVDCVDEKRTKRRNRIEFKQRTLSAPREVASLQTQSAVLQAATADADGVDLVRAHLGHGGRASDLIFALLLVDVAAATGEAALMAGVTANACSRKSGKD
jgi:hypothetical protein